MTRPSLRPEGTIVQLDGETYYRIAHVDRMPTFLMSIPSDTDLWMFVAANGGLTAGRGDAEGSLFPYETVDRLYDSRHHTGPITLIRVAREGGSVLWEPFAELGAERFRIERHLYKSLVGNSVVFEEINHDLGLAFRYRWSAAESFGLVRTARLMNVGEHATAVELLDGLRDVLPFGGSLALYQTQSCLVDAYKRSEYDPATGLAIFSLSAQITDRAEAAEQLRANVVWGSGLLGATVALSDSAVEAFRRGEAISSETVRTGRRGHFLRTAALGLPPNEHVTWHTVADAKRTPVDIVRLQDRLRAGGDPSAAIERAIAEATQALRANVAAADGLQCTGQPVGSMHHFANVLFNNMRGGVFADGYRIPVADLRDFLHTRNHTVAARHDGWLHTLGNSLELGEWLAAAARRDDADLERLAFEYLPLHFGRRHGDPSRPWNRFSIRARRPDGAPTLYYEGNWRDVFQNWEALAQSFPGFLPSMVAKFVNASTLDGFNPYRITRDGVDWEVIEPESPWSYIGYWGDHQVVYLLRLLESTHRFAPDALASLLDRPVFSYANVPYRLKSYQAMRLDPHATIDFDAALHERIMERTAHMGTDGRLVFQADGSIRHANLIEKLLVTALARLSNYVADAGIWMNTQRPEWNDANNALAGNGVSTVTLCYLRRYLGFFAERLRERTAAPVTLSTEVMEWMARIVAVLAAHRPTPGSGRTSDTERKAILDGLGQAFADYRGRVYASGLTSQTAVPVQQLLALCDVANEHLDHAIALNRRSDGLYHAYHVLGPLDRDALECHPLYEMLEGQVAALSTGSLAPSDAADLVDRLFESQMYDPARLSFMLYPERPLPAFLEKNRFALQRAHEVPLLRDLLAAGEETLVVLDAAGQCRFHADLGQLRLLVARLDALAARPEWTAAVARDRQAVLDLFEEVFHHRSFTGRSGTMYGYEGLGCIYWHMVTKLLLAVQEQALAALDCGDAAATRLIAHYYRIRSGLGFERTPGEYGAFPTDPYSHTPRHAGAQQPGMTGQVKEEILARFGELGVGLHAGRATFRPRMLRRSEFLDAARSWTAIGTDGASHEWQVPRDALAFTWCGTPVVYQLTEGEAWVQVVTPEGDSGRTEGDTLDADSTAALLRRTGGIVRIEVGVPRGVVIEAVTPD